MAPNLQHRGGVEVPWLHDTTTSCHMISYRHNPNFFFGQLCRSSPILFLSTMFEERGSGYTSENCIQVPGTREVSKKGRGHAGMSREKDACMGNTRTQARAMFGIRIK